MAMILQACCAMSFAFANRLAGTVSFITFCMFLRTVQGFAAGLSEVTAGSLLIRSVPEANVGRVIGWSEAARGVGIMLGPLVGGGLYQRGGFAMPFCFSAPLLAFLAVGMRLAGVGNASDPPPDLLADGNTNDGNTADGNTTDGNTAGVGTADGNITDGNTAGGSNLRMLALVRLPLVAASLFQAFLSVACFFAIDPTIAPFLAAPPFSLGPTICGLVCSSSLLSYEIVSGMIGRVARRVGDRLTLTIGMVVSGVGFFALGPSDQFELPLSLVPSFARAASSRSSAVALATAALLTMGLGSACVYIPATNLMLATAAEKGWCAHDASDAIAALNMQV